MNCEVAMDYSEEEMKDFYYSAVRMVTKIDYRIVRELFDLGVIKSHRDMYELAGKKKIDTGDYGLSSPGTRRVTEWIENNDRVLRACDEYMRIASENGISVISCEDSSYPANFRVLSGMPKVIYLRGDKELLNKCSRKGSAAIVGSRKAGRYALFATERFAGELSSKGITVVSGMALGVDRKAHEAALKECGSTIAILAGGPDNIYPPENSALYKQIIGNGLVLSEMPPGQQPLRQYFPSRNRLIAGLSDCTLIMEAGAASGTLHTASFAASQGKEVFVLPNSIYYENAAGGLKLLEDGCNVLLSTDSVIDSVSQAIIRRKMEYPELVDDMDIKLSDKETRKAETDKIRLKADKTPDEVTEDEWKILIEDELSVKPLDIDNLCRALGLPFYRISELLIGLQLSGRVVLENGKYALTFL